MTEQEKSILMTAKLAGATKVMIDMFPFNKNDILFLDDRNKEVFTIEEDFLFEFLDTNKIYNIDEVSDC